MKLINEDVRFTKQIETKEIVPPPKKFILSLIVAHGLCFVAILLSVATLERYFTSFSNNGHS